jgi:hypothetical protein
LTTRAHEKLSFYFSQRVTDNEMRFLHDVIQRAAVRMAVMDTIILLVGASLLMSLVVMIDIWLNGVDP